MKKEFINWIKIGLRLIFFGGIALALTVSYLVTCEILLEEFGTKLDIWLDLSKVVVLSVLWLQIMRTIISFEEEAS